MVRFFSVVAREVRGMHEAAYLLAAFALGSQLLALVRDRILAAHFGAGHTLDLYYAAFRIPDFLFATVASLLSLYALLPVLSRLDLKDPRLIVGFLRKTLLAFFICMGVVAGVLFFFVPWLLDLMAPGLTHDPSSRDQLILLVRILLLQPILLGASNTLASLTQLRHRFVLYSLSPLLYNVGIIFGALVLYDKMGVAGLGWGVVIGALLHMSLQVPFLFERTAKKIPFKEVVFSLREVLMLSVPRTLALSAGQLSLVAIVALASLLYPGSIAIFTFAFNLQAVPLTIIGVSYSVAAFPTLAHLYAQGKKAEFTAHIETALRHIIFWSIPATVFVIVLRAQLVRVILGAGAFDWSATRLTAAALALFILSLCAQSISLLIARAYYAAGITNKPLYFGTLDVIVSIGASLGLLVVFNNSLLAKHFIESALRVSDIAGTTVLMLALGYACGSIARFLVSFIYFGRDFGVSRSKLLRLFFETFSSSIIGGACTYGILALTGIAGTINTTLGLVLQGVVAGGVGLAVTAGLLVLLKNQEIKEALSAFSRRIFKQTEIIDKTVAVEPTDVSS